MLDNHEIEQLMSKRVVIVLHDVTKDRVVGTYPQLDEKLMLVSSLGTDNLACLITREIRRPPRNLPD
ncbi:hypothetical protein [Nitrosomonas sp.]|uniref:hypothetical protein n=1 Tax=Nitrosomonas sp. TaxID=42353 RepID=UPI002083CFF2|nr:hypothetical protein [Nitrosomonas sp.]GJL76899.1 MAG: hypothetical protein NMNS02_30050 [Nitrosomonas sp.]